MSTPARSRTPKLDEAGRALVEREVETFWQQHQPIAQRVGTKADLHKLAAQACKQAEKTWNREGEFEAFAADRIRAAMMAAAIEGRNQLAVQWMPMAKKLANEYCQSRHSVAPNCGGFEDVLQMAYVALIEAAERFDPVKFGTKFSTLACTHIRMRLRSMTTGLGLIRVPNYMFAAARADRYMADRERATLVCRWPSMSTGEPIELPCGAPAVGSRLTDEETIHKVRAVVAGLPPRDRFVMECRYGFGENAEPMTYKAIAKLIGVTRSAVQQQVRVLHERLRFHLKDQVA